MDLKSVELFLDLVSDPKKYKQVLTDLSEQNQKLQEQIKLVGEAAEIGKLRAEAAQLVAEQEKTLADVKQRSESFLSKEMAKLKALIEQQREREANLSQKEHAFEETLKELDKEKEQLVAKKQELELFAKSLFDQEQDLLARERDLKNKLQVLKTLGG